jgi:DNA-binding response OmpR family regulator
MMLGKERIFVVSDKATILLVEGKRGERPSLFPGLTKKGFLVETAASGSAAVLHLSEKKPHVVLVDAASMRTSGKRIVQSIRQKFPTLPVVLILDVNTDTSDTVIDANAVLVQPFTLQKLLNRIRPLLPAEEDKDILKAGSLQLDVERRWVKTGDRQVSLTPRLVALLKALIDRQGEVIERTELFRLVWETGYTGDTRTLDVHISWLRQAVEEDPRKPKFIKTVRGVGYRLDTESNIEPATRPVRELID